VPLAIPEKFQAEDEYPETPPVNESFIYVEASPLTLKLRVCPLTAEFGLTDKVTELHCGLLTPQTPP
jgi:hypothetical protein